MRKTVPRGFTLIELMVTVAVMAIVLGLAVPGFQSVVNGNRLAGASNEMVASLQTARMEAIRRSRRVVVCTSANANEGDDATCATANIDGWITFVDANSDGDFDKVGDTLLRNSTFDGNVLVGGNDTVMYRADGLARSGAGVLMTAGNVRMRIDTSQPVQNVRCIDITTGGVVVRTPPAHDANCS
jgi:type IV fimbrial biogenesis protein FimT